MFLEPTKTVVRGGEYWSTKFEGISEGGGLGVGRGPTPTPPPVTASRPIALQ